MLHYFEDDTFCLKPTSEFAYRLLTQSNIFLELEIMCSSWPESRTFGCYGDGGWRLLDSSMTFSDSANCESLCRMEKEDGCCFLKRGTGCYWKSGGHSDSHPDATAISVTCGGSGKIQIVCFKNQP